MATSEGPHQGSVSPRAVTSPSRSTQGIPSALRDSILYSCLLLVIGFTQIFSIVSGGLSNGRFVAEGVLSRLTEIQNSVNSLKDGL